MVRRYVFLDRRLLYLLAEDCEMNKKLLVDVLP